MEPQDLFLRDEREPMAALKRRASDYLSAGSSKSFDSSAVDLSASNDSLANADLSSPAPLLIPTPSLPSSQVSEDGGAQYSYDEQMSILRAEKLVMALRHRFDCQPDR
jgi:hypothetical protein